MRAQLHSAALRRPAALPQRTKQSDCAHRAGPGRAQHSVHRASSCVRRAQPAPLRQHLPFQGQPPCLRRLLVLLLLLQSLVLGAK